jgi:hypothetical protein
MNVKAGKRPDRMPGKTAIGLTAMWVALAYLLFASGILWTDLADHGGLDELDEVFPLIILGALAFLNLVLVIAIHLRQNWARLTAVVVGVLGIVIGFISFGTSILAALVQIAVSVVIVAMIASERTEAWCDR